MLKTKEKESEEEGMVVYSKSLITTGKYFSYWEYLFENKANKSKGVFY